MTVEELLHHTFDWELAPGVAAAQDAVENPAAEQPLTARPAA